MHASGNRYEAHGVSVSASRDVDRECPRLACGESWTKNVRAV
jgi:hypothetical protein